MSASDFVWGRYPLDGNNDASAKNTSGVAMVAAQLVKVDAANLISGTQPIIGVTLTTAIANFGFGFTVENIPIAYAGRIQISGIAVATAETAITGGAIVGASAATSGDVVTYTAANPSVGQACSAAVSAADPILVRIAPSKNA